LHATEFNMNIHCIAAHTFSVYIHMNLISLFYTLYSNYYSFPAIM